MTANAPGTAPRNATIDDVAQAAGVSKGTVSNVINGRIPVAPETRRRVEQAITDLAFRPAESGRALTARKRMAEPKLDASVPRLTTIGYVSVDYFARLDRLPERDERLLSREIVKSIGGPAANVAAVGAGLGAPLPVAASLITVIGVDQESDWAAAELAARRVDLIMPRERRSGRLSRAIVMVEADGRRTIINEPSSLAAVDVRDFIETTDSAGLRWCLHFEGYQVPRQIGLLPIARAKGFCTSMQATGLPPNWLAENAAQVFAGFDIVVLHRESLAMIPGCPTDPTEGLRHLAKLGRGSGVWPEVIAVTLGAEGAAVLTREGLIERVPAPMVPVVDTTGAGDAFVGTFLAAWLNGRPAREAASLACMAGSLAITQVGAQVVRPSVAELMSRFEGVEYRNVISAQTE
ncbi:ribokinase [Bosea sp. CRIB-10]|uniref:carbohydrate kinase family protein n=1 Tax=Bosea sp. CRIB-10 TaxID=378404 RepID=UPI0008E1AE4C|nr:carbohydrate kinase family protein [Bosea sp. CRIB-10]SFD51871.1 ribokinase [Bosea sp. CRIB-10]